MERKLHKGGNSCSSTSPRSTEVSKDHGIVVEHYVQISNLEEQLSQKTDENPPLMSQPQIQQLHSSPRRRVLPNVVNSNPIDLPSALLNNNSIINRSIGFRVRRFIGSSSSRHNWSLVLHGFPLLVLLCFFLLWWFSSPVNLAIKDGRIIQSFSVQKAVSLNDTELNLSRMTILAVAASPNSNIQTSAQFILSVIENVGDPSAEGSNR